MRIHIDILISGQIAMDADRFQGREEMESCHSIHVITRGDGMASNTRQIEHLRQGNEKWSGIGGFY